MITMTALVLGRLVSLWLDGGELVGFDLASLFYRVLAAALAAAAWHLVRERPEPEPERLEPATRETGQRAAETLQAWRWSAAGRAGTG